MPAITRSKKGQAATVKAVAAKAIKVIKKVVKAKEAPKAKKVASYVRRIIRLGEGKDRHFYHHVGEKVTHNGMEYVRLKHGRG